MMPHPKSPDGRDQQATPGTGSPGSPAGILLGLALALVSLTAPSLSAQAVSNEVCSLGEPIWFDAGGSESTVGRAWFTGRRDDDACELSLAAWARSSWVSSYASSRPDGLTAPAVLTSVSVSGGGHVRRGRLEIRVMPEVTWHQNGDVEIPASPFDDARRFGYWRPTIDLPHRFGADAFALVGPGRSGIRLHLGDVSVGLDAEPVRWGPSRRYPLLLSGQQASLPRVGVRTEHPIEAGGLGSLDLNLLFARLTTSEWFSGSVEGNDRVMAGVALAWTPGPFPGLTLGFSSLHHQNLDDFGLSSALDFVQSPAQDTRDNSPGNGLGNLWVAWSSADLGLDVWVEWMKDDYNRSFTQLLIEPEKGSGRTLGLRQEVEAGAGRLSLHLEAGSTRNTRPLATDPDGARGIIYTNGSVPEGHTHRGQLLGAIIGPGGDGQFVEVAYHGASHTAVQLERLRFNTDTYTERLGQPLGDEGYDVEIVGRVLHERASGDIRVRGELELGARHNRLFLQDDPSWDGNVRLGLMLLWSR